MGQVMRLPVRERSLHLSEEPSAGVDLLAALEDDEYAAFAATCTEISAAAGTVVFRQGDLHDGIFIILSGQMRIFYTGPSGREITLAYWAPGNFCGGPEIFGGSPHMWSGQAVRPSRLLHVRGPALRRQMERSPRLAVALVDALVHKGRCFSALIHMLGTRSAAERLAQLLVLMAEMEGRRRSDGIVIGRTLTQEDLARMVGSTRQWVSSTLDRFRADGLIEVTPHRIVIKDEARLRALGA
ncbi:MAG TPA: Crp/Fnr family transcriptional regulator [Magnetospirillum sp.]|nr:Crp/Fnr family transcriptional regulator [Magnetospirillum sp.]